MKVFNMNTDNGINEVKIDRTIFVILRSAFAFTKKNSDAITNKYVDKVPDNNTLFFSSPVSHAKSSTLKTTTKLITADDIEAVNHLVNLLIYITIPFWLRSLASLLLSVTFYTSINLF